ncbi:MAG: hypothetical protein HY824_04600 [Acidobacteria bacterium]|nr:hypothetical protein [Acidobacteriota bacterium]
MRNRYLVVALCLGGLSLCASRAAAQDHVAELGVMLWKPSPELSLSSDAVAGSSVNQVDFVQEFGIEEKWFPEFRAAIGRGHKFRVSHVKFSYDAEATIQRTFSFQGRTFSVGAPASTDINWDLWTVGYEWDFVSRPQGYFGVIADLKVNTIKASVDSPALRSTAATDTTAPVPTIGVAGRGYLSKMIAIGAEFSGLKVDRSDFNVKFFDFDINGMVAVTPNVGAQVGYRSVTATYVVDQDTGDLKMKGPYVGAFVRF